MFFKPSKKTAELATVSSSVLVGMLASSLGASYMTSAVLTLAAGLLLKKGVDLSQRQENEFYYQ